MEKGKAVRTQEKKLAGKEAHTHTPSSREEWLSQGGEHHHHHHGEEDFYDYTEAVNAYKKTFPRKEQVQDHEEKPQGRLRCGRGRDRGQKYAAGRGRGSSSPRGQRKGKHAGA